MGRKNYGKELFLLRNRCPLLCLSYEGQEAHIFFISLFLSVLQTFLHVDKSEKDQFKYVLEPYVVLFYLLKHCALLQVFFAKHIFSILGHINLVMKLYEISKCWKNTQ